MPDARCPARCGSRSSYSSRLRPPPRPRPPRFVGRGRALTGREHEAEVEHPRPTVLVDDHVVGLEVAVNEPGLVRGREAPRRLHVHGDDLGHAALSLLEPAPQGHALDQLHRDEGAPFVLTNLVDVRDVDVTQLGHRRRLAPQPRLPVGRTRRVRPQDFDRNLAVQFVVARFVDDGHAALADALLDAVTPYVDRRGLAPHEVLDRPTDAQLAFDAPASSFDGGSLASSFSSEPSSERVSCSIPAPASIPAARPRAAFCSAGGSPHVRFKHPDNTIPP